MIGNGTPGTAKNRFAQFLHSGNWERQKTASLNFCTPEIGNGKTASLNFCTPEIGNGKKPLRSIFALRKLGTAKNRFAQFLHSGYWERQKTASLNFCTPEIGNGKKPLRSIFALRKLGTAKNRFAQFLHSGNWERQKTAIAYQFY